MASGTHDSKSVTMASGASFSSVVYPGNMRLAAVEFPGSFEGDGVGFQHYTGSAWNALNTSGGTLITVSSTTGSTINLTVEQQSVVSNFPQIRIASYTGSSLIAQTGARTLTVYFSGNY